MLTSTERDLIARAFANGPSVLLEEGYSQEDVQKFCARPDVAAHFALLDREMDLRQELEERTRHSARRQLARLSPGAVAIVAQALAGPQYLTYKTAEGHTAIQTDAAGKPVMLRAEVTPTQVRAAEVIMETLGIPYGRAKNEAAPGVGSKVGMLFKVADADAMSVVADDPAYDNDAQRCLSRERVRTVIAVLSRDVVKMHDNMNANLRIGIPAPSAPRRKKAPRGTSKSKKGQS